MDKELHNIDRFNSVCLPPFMKDGKQHYSYLCEVFVYSYLSYFTFVYATDKEHAMEVLKEEYKEYHNHKVL